MPFPCISHTHTHTKTLSRKLSHRKGNFGELYLMTRDKEVPGRFHGLQSVTHKGPEKHFFNGSIFIFSTPSLSPLSFWYSMFSCFSPSYLYYSLLSSFGRYANELCNKVALPHCWRRLSWCKWDEYLLIH